LNSSGFHLAITNLAQINIKTVIAINANNPKILSLIYSKIENNKFCHSSSLFITILLPLSGIIESFILAALAAKLYCKLDKYQNIIKFIFFILIIYC